jgi:hypothetical protein
LWMWSLHLLHRTHDYDAALNEPTSDVVTSSVVARVRKFLLQTGELSGGRALDPVGSSAGGRLRWRLKEALNTTTVTTESESNARSGDFRVPCRASPNLGIEHY